MWRWFDDRTGASKVWSVTASHMVPRSTGWWYVFGSATAKFAFIVQVATGIALATIYVPSYADAYHLCSSSPNRPSGATSCAEMHYFGASAMVLFVSIHLDPALF